MVVGVKGKMVWEWWWRGRWCGSEGGREGGVVVVMEVKVVW